MFCRVFHDTHWTITVCNSFLWNILHCGSHDSYCIPRYNPAQIHTIFLSNWPLFCARYCTAFWSLPICFHMQHISICSCSFHIHEMHFVEVFIVCSLYQYSLHIDLKCSSWGIAYRIDHLSAYLLPRCLQCCFTPLKCAQPSSLPQYE